MNTDSSLDVFAWWPHFCMKLFHDCVYAVTLSLLDEQLVLFHWQLQY